MNRALILLVLILGIQHSYSQNETKVTFSFGKMYMIRQDSKTNEVITEQPFAKVRSIIYDTFYKSYDILVTTPEGKDTGFSLSYVNYDKKTNLIRMKDKQNDYWYAVDNLDKNGLLYITNETAKNGIILSFKFVNLIKD